ncbi:MAG: hypothetical protein ACE5FI_11865, partial [Anaerolineales bacterium]
AADTPEWLQESMSTPAESEPAPTAESEAPDAATAATDDQLPDWLSSAPEAAPEAAAEEPAADTPEWLQDAMAAPTEPEPAAAEPGDEDPIPEFLRDAGWSERDPSIELDDLPPIPDDVPLAPPPGSDAPDWLQEAMGARAEPSSEEPEIEPAEIPDWLADKQPAETEPAVEAPPVPEMEAEPVEKPEWLPKSAAEDDDEQAPSPTGELPDWLADAESSPDDTIVGWLKDTQPAAAVDQPDWLRTPEEAPSEPATVDDDIPNWLRDAGGESQEAAPAQASDEPELADWLAEVEDSSGQPVVRYGATDADPFSETSDKVDTGDFESTLPAAPASDGEDMEVWVAAGTETHEPEVAADVVEPVETAAAPEPPPTDQDDALAWLEGLAAKQGAREEELITPSEERSEDMPDWVAAMAAGDGASAVEPAAQAEATESGDDGAATESEDARDWLQPQPDATPEPEIDAAALPDWLRQPESETPTAEVESEADTSPDEAEMSAATGTAPELADEDAALAWLEGLAAKQGAREEELITAPEKRTDELPAWVSEMAAGVPTNELTEDVTEPEPTMTPEVEEPVATLPVEETPKEPAEPLATELPDWLTEPRGETGALSETDGEAPALPDWLSEPSAPSAAAESAPAEFAWPGAAPESEAPEPAAAAEFELSSPPAALEPKVEVDVHAEETPEMEDEAEPARAEALPGAADQTEPASEQFEADIAAVPDIEEPAADQFEVESPVAAAPVPTAPETAVQPATTEMDAAESLEKAPAEEAVAPAPAAQPVTPAVRPARPTKRSPEEVLARARDFLADDDIERALKHYGKLLKSSDVLDTVIADLEQAASETFDAPVELLQTLGDAYMKGNQLQKALDTYRRALHSI